MDVDGDGTRRSQRVTRSRTSASRSAGSTGRSSSAVEPNVRAGRAERRGRLDHRGRAARPGFRAARLAQPRRAGTPALANLPGLVQLQREHPAPEPAAAGRHRPGRVGDPAGARRHGVDVAVREPGRVRAHLRADPLAGVPAKSMILQFARGDKTVPNPTTSAIIRAGGLAGPDDALPERPRGRAPVPRFSTNPHTFLTNIAGLAPPVRAVRGGGPGCRSRMFFASGGATVDRPGRRRARSSRRRWSAHRRRIWPTSRNPLAR